MHRRDFIAAAGASAVLAPLPVRADAQYPGKPVKLIVPFPPGGPTDIMGRTAARALSEKLGQQFVVENRAGAGGNIGTDAIAKAAPDGYTIGLSAISSLAIGPYIYSKMPFSVEKDLAPVSLVGTTPCAIVVNPAAPFQDLKGLIAYAKANPEKLNYATSGVGTSNHLAAELLQATAGIRLTHVPYKGSSQIVPDLLSGTILMSVESSLATTLQHIKQGKLRGIAVTSPRRSRYLPDLPTVTEQGFPGFAVESWFGLVAPAATPKSIVDKLNATWRDSTTAPATLTAFEGISADVRSNTPQQFAEFIAAENARWGPLIRKLEIKVD